MMDLNQTKYYVLILKLELKAREFNVLCRVLDEAKEKNINPNDESLLELKQQFLSNQDEIKDIKKAIEKLNEDYDEKFNIDDMFKNVKEMKIEDIRKELELVSVEDKKDNWFKMILDKIKSFFNK